MAFNLRNRSFLKEIDFEPRELRFLLRALRGAQDSRSTRAPRRKRLDGKEIALIFEKTSTRTRSAFEVAAFDQGAHVTYLDPSGSQLGHKESIADTAARARPHVRRDRVPRQRARPTSRSSPRTPACRSTTGSPTSGTRRRCSPTSSPCTRRATSPTTQLAYAFVGDCRFNMGRSLLVMGALMGSDVRLAGPRGAAPAEGRRRHRRGHRRPHRCARSRSPTTPRRPWPASTSSTPTCGCRWARPRTSGPSGSGC